MWYNFYKIQDVILNEIKSKRKSLDDFSNLGKILKFLTIENLIEEKLINQVYFETNHPPCFLNESTVLNIESAIKENFNENLSISKLTRKEVDHNSDKFVKFNVKSKEEYKQIFELFIENSNFGISYKSEKEEKKNIAEKNQKKHLDSVQKIKIKKREAFNNKSDLNVDFSKTRVACIDLEFFIHKGNINKRRTHEITEIGIAYVSPHQKRNEHFLIKENYEKKKNREKQGLFNFGNTTILTEEGAKKYLDVFLKNVDYILFHEGREDLLALKQIGIDVEKNYPNIQIIDTQLMYKRFFGENRVNNIIGGEPLNVLLDNFGVEYKSSYLHNGGNDAEYTLQLLFSMQKTFESRKNVNVKSKDENMEFQNALNVIEKYARENNVSVIDLIKKHYSNENNISEEEVIKKTNSFKR
jgi:hypothetical protein